MKTPISQDLDRLLTIYSNMSSVERQNESFTWLMQKLIVDAARSEDPEEEDYFARIGGQE